MTKLEVASSLLDCHVEFEESFVYKMLYMGTSFGDEPGQNVVRGLRGYGKLWPVEHVSGGGSKSANNRSGIGTRYEMSDAVLEMWEGIAQLATEDGRSFNL